MKVIILGSATSTGVPIIGCGCPVCTSANPRNKRTRCSLFVEVMGENILIDTSTDLRCQALRHGIARLDAVLYTHSHADHTHGIDELRIYNFVNKSSIRCYGNAQTVENIKDNFKYIFDGVESAGGKPKLTLSTVSGEFDFDGIKITPVDVYHADWTILGYRIGGMAYLTDCSGIPDGRGISSAASTCSSSARSGTSPIPPTLTWSRRSKSRKELKPRLTVLTHMGHELDYDTLSKELPDSIVPAYDGMELELPEP